MALLIGESLAKTASSSLLGMLNFLACSKDRWARMGVIVLQTINKVLENIVYGVDPLQSLREQARWFKQILI